MAALMMIFTVLGLWFLVSALVDWDWGFGVIDFQEAEVLLGTDAVRWLVGGTGLALVSIGLSGWLRIG